MVHLWLFLIGSKDYHDRLGYVIHTCPDCEVRGVFTVVQERKKATLYLVPTFQYSKKQFMHCPTCGEVFEVASEIKKELKRKLISREELVDKIKSGKIEKLLKKGKKGGKTTQLKCCNCGGFVLKGMNYCPDCGVKQK